MLCHFFYLSLHDALPIFTDLPFYVLEKEMKIHFENEKYPIVLGLAEKILKDLKMNLKSNQVTSSSYLIAFQIDRKSTRLNSSHVAISYAVFFLKKKTIRN